jgi:hypothetical protein
LIGAIAATVVGTRRKARDARDNLWWLTTALFLMLPAIALIFLA